LKALLAQKDNSRDRSLASNILKALLAQKKQFKGPKPCLEYLEGAAGPKRQFEGPKPCLEYLEGAAGPKEAIQNNFDRKLPRRSKHSLPKETHSKRSAKDRVVKKPCVYSGGTKERSTKTSKEIQSRNSECKGCIPLRFERTLTSLTL
jgi:hypothetical protein